MRHLRRGVALAAVALGVLAGPAAAHPLGNFSENHLTRVTISSDRLELHYILDQAEIPTFQERGRSVAAILASKRATVLQGLSTTLDGQPLRLTLAAGGRLTRPLGQGGLRTTRVELDLSAPLAHMGTVELRDGTFPGRVGWKAVIVAPGNGTAVRSSVPQGDPTNGLRAYPKSLLDSPSDVRSARFGVRAGAGTVNAPRARGEGAPTTRERSGDTFTRVFDDAAAGRGAFLLRLLIAFGWGALHAVSPGHGKAMVAAYLVGTRGTSRDAVLLGLTVTVTHTIGVFALGLVTLALSAYVLPEQLYPWLNLASGLLVVGVGAVVLRSRLRQRGSGGDHGAAQAHSHADLPDESAANSHSHANERDHVPALAYAHVQAHAHAVELEAGVEDHAHDHDVHDHSHDHGEGAHAGGHHKPHDHGHRDRAHGHDHGSGYHTHEIPDRVSPKSLVAMGISAGLIPCPSALVVLLAAIAQHQIGLGLVLIIAFSAGLAATLTALGIAVVHAGRLTARVDTSSRVFAALPSVSAALILCVGLALTLQAIPKL